MGKRPPAAKITGFRFREARLTCLLSVPAAAKLLQVSERTIRNWEHGTARVPYAAYKLMRILRGYELPGEAWTGWRLVGDTLYTPEGRHIHAWESAWWWLLIEQARAFRTALAARSSTCGRQGPQPDRAAPPLGLVSSPTTHTETDPTQQNRGFAPPDPGAGPGPGDPVCAPSFPLLTRFVTPVEVPRVPA